MFPINYNDPYTKNDGSVVPVGDVIGGGGGSDIPSHTVADAGKVLMVTDENTLTWGEVSSAGGFRRASSTTFSYSGMTPKGGDN